MQRCEVLIVGGGPAGSTCAWKLHQAGVDTVVLDKSRFPRDKTCAGWVTPPVLDMLAFDASEYCKRRVFQPITGFRTGLIGGGEIETNYERPVSFGIRRCEFDHYLLERSVAPHRLGTPLDSAERSNGRWIINGEIEASLLVGAGGHFCPVARLLGGRERRRASVVAAQEIEFPIPEEYRDRISVQAACPELFFCSDLSGYGWCFRKGEFLNIGLGRLQKNGLSKHVAEFRDFLQERGKVTCAVPDHFHGHAYLLYERAQPRLIDDGVLLIGDAAGLAYPHSGEGIRPAVESGLMAADAVLDAAGDYRRDRLKPYCDRIVGRFGKPRRRAAADYLPSGWLAAVAGGLLANKWFSRHVLLDRWFLHTHETALSP